MFLIHEYEHRYLLKKFNTHNCIMSTIQVNIFEPNLLSIKIIKLINLNYRCIEDLQNKFSKH